MKDIIQHIKEFYMFLWEFIKDTKYFFLAVFEVIVLVILPIYLIIRLISWLF